MKVFTAAIATACVIGIMGATLSAKADPYDHHDWRGHNWRHHWDHDWDHGRYGYYAPPPTYYAPPAYSYYRPPPVYYGAPGYYAPPGFSFGVTIP